MTRLDGVKPSGAVASAVTGHVCPVAGAVAGGVITALLGVMIGGLWFTVPLVSREQNG